uniref:WRKY transcription factor 32 n=1 Tax=Iris germanica TaxID=34205 RepID=A0A977MBD3_IRIGE|nr:WRKY transcription factor 32 [Iris germanica]
MDPESTRIDQEKAIRELLRGRELMDDLSRLVQGTFSSHDDDRSELAGGYCRGVKKAFEVGISLVKSIDATVPLEFHSPTSVPLQTNGGPGSTAGVGSSNSGDENPRGKRRASNSKTTVTHSPFADGYQWRKYGQKVIRNVKYTRSYYRCTHTGCRAKLLVQQIADDSGSIPMYEVTRNNEHSCNAISPPPVFQHGSPATPRRSNIITFESDQSVPCRSARGTNEQVHNFFSSIQQMQNRSGEMLSPRISDTSSSSLPHTSTVPAQSHQALPIAGPDIKSNLDSCFPPLSPAGQFYGPDASAYL